jgi:uncharacterized phage protein (TIGR02220 family)
MTGWTPLFQQIVGSSVWSAQNHVRIAWITMLAIADKFGVAACTVGGLSALARISREEAEDALKVLSSPDSDTLTQANEGRRIVRVEGGWKILNWEIYRAKAKAALVREYNREAQAKYRDGQKQFKLDVEPVQRQYHVDARSVLAYLNECSGKKFRDTDPNLALISARLIESGVSADGVRIMIHRMTRLWKATKMEEYLRPETLFGKTKFDNYYAAKDQPIYDANDKPKPATSTTGWGEQGATPGDPDLPGL